MLLSLLTASVAHALLPCSLTVPPQIVAGDLDLALSTAPTGSVVCLEGADYALADTVVVSADLTLQPAPLAGRPRITHDDGDPLFVVPTARSVLFVGVELDGAGERPLQIVNAQVILADVWLRGGQASQGGCARVESGGHLELSGGEVFDCESTGGRGGGVQVVDGTLSVSGTTFHDNAVDGDRGGGAIYLESGAGSVISGAIFEGNTAESDSRGGGAIYVHSADGLLISDAHFEGNAGYGDRGGGAIYVENPSGLIIERSTFDTNAASGSSSGGGALYGLDDGSGTPPIVRDSLFCRNTTTGDGGALWLQGADPTIERTAFWANQANGSGGGLHIGIGGNADLTLDHVSLVANTALGGRGHALWNDRDQLTLTHSYIGWHGLLDEAVYSDNTSDTVGTFNAYEGNAADTNGQVQQSDLVAIGQGTGIAEPFACGFDSFAPPASSPLASGGAKGDYVGAVEPLPPVDTSDTAPTGDTGVPSPTATTGDTAVATETALPTTGMTADTAGPTTPTTGTGPTDSAVTTQAPAPNKAAAGCRCDTQRGPGPWPWLGLLVAARRR